MSRALGRKRKEALLKKFNHCYYCKVEMVWYGLQKGEKQPDNFATWDHINQKYDHPDGRPAIGRLVLACRKCNESRAIESEKALPKSELWRRSNSPPKHMRKDYIDHRISK